MRRHWCTFDAVDFRGHQVTSYGPSDRVRGGMLAFCDSAVRLPAPVTDDGPAVIITTKDLARLMRETGHAVLTDDNPRAAFWAAFRKQARSLLKPASMRVDRSLGRIRKDLGSSIAPTARIGSVALKTYEGKLVPNMGGVHIEDGASIGEFTAIDAGIYGEDTEIHKGAHIDNLVHVAHSVIVGEGATVVAGSVLGGWCEIGARAWIGIGASIRDSAIVGEGAMVGMGAVVIRDVEPHTTVVGNPARVLHDQS